ncbi:MAG: hypothetical protein WAU17_02420 [Nitrospirales bacterium]
MRGPSNGNDDLLYQSKYAKKSLLPHRDKIAYAITEKLLACYQINEDTTILTPDNTILF